MFAGMDGDDLSNGSTGQTTDPEVNETSEASVITEKLSALSLNGHHQEPAEKPEKDPRKIARKYQMDLCQKAMEENVVVYLGTGCGKTHIAILLIYQMGHLIKKPQKNICVFLAPTVALVQQQAKVIEESIDFKVGIYCGSSNRLKSHHDWEKEMEQYEIFVMTPQVLLHNLSHCFIRMELISLLIFDECHYAQLESSHPYAEIMKVFYKADVPRLPRIFGMTASPKLGKGASIDSLESLLQSKVYSVEDKDELEQFVSSPKVNIYFYGPVTSDSSCPYLIYSKKLEEIKYQCVSELRRKIDDRISIRSTKRALLKLHGNLLFCLESLGVWGALQASRVLLKGDHSERAELVEAEGDCSDNSLCDKYLIQAASIFTSDRKKGDLDSDLSCVEVLMEPFFSRKLLRLIGILSKFRLRPNMKCIVFVNRIVTARSLSYILQNLKILFAWKCDFLVGVHSGLKSMSRKNTNIILEKFRSGELNLLVATKVGEEGLDIQTCCLVIRFDLPETVASFIQSRGRARMPQSEYAFLVNSGNQRELNLIEHFTRDEARMNAEISTRKSHQIVTEHEERTYKVDATGATISSVSSVSLLHRYCSKLPHDEYFNPKPYFFYFDDMDGMVCHIILPSNAPIHQIVSAPQSSREAAKRDACLKACQELHGLGALTDFLLPEEEEEDDGSSEDSFDSGSFDDEESRRELHEMLLPTALKEPWATNLDESVCLSCYYIKICPNPPDRVYKEYALFIKASLPGEAEKMKLTLPLARGRSVMTELIPFGVVTFAKEEMVLAQKFQKMSLKLILDRSDFIEEFISLENREDDIACTPTFYLLLPVILLRYNEVGVDWDLIRRCLSSPIFRSQEVTGGVGISPLDNHLQLANGPKTIDDIVNSLVYVPCKNTFFFVSDIVSEKNAYSLFKDEKSHLEHYIEKFRVHLQHPDQPLLKAKQLFCLDNLLRKKGNSESREKEEHFVDLPPEICQLKIVGFSKDIGSSFSLLPSIMHRLESLLVAIELKDRLSASFPEGSEITANRILEALTTEKCNEPFSLERLEVLGDAFLKFAVGRHLFLSHDALDEGQLTRKRSNIVNNSNLLKLAIRNNLQVYIHDQSFEPNQFFALGRPCPVFCDKNTEKSIHSLQESINDVNAEIRCSKCHHWLHKKTIADVVEALIGAFIVDSGFKAAIAFLKWIGIHLNYEAEQVNNICCASKTFLPLVDHMDISAVENSLGYNFVHKGLLIQAFVHPSYNNHWGGCYQRLEFLGDAVLDYLITSYLFSVYPNLKPGQLTDLRSATVNNISFANIAVRMSFYKHIICDSNGLLESINKYVNFIGSPKSVELVEEPHCPKALGDLVESCMGAILLDTGFDLNHVWNIVLSLLDPVVSFSKLRLNPVRELQELCQSCNWELQFSSSKKDGRFLVEAKVSGENVSLVCYATNRSIKGAKSMAALQFLENLKAQGYKSKSKSLEETLRMSRKMEAVLVGYDESSSQNSFKYRDVKVQRAASLDCDLKVQPLSGAPKRICNDNLRPTKYSSPTREIRKWQPKETVKNNGYTDNSQATVSSNGFHANSQATGTFRNVSAKSRLYELCAANCWKPPTFECYKETGPSHLKEFIFIVKVEIDEASDMILECYGDPRTKKKDAAEHAAEGALWWLKGEGYM